LDEMAQTDNAERFRDEAAEAAGGRRARLARRIKRPGCDSPESS